MITCIVCTNPARPGDDVCESCYADVKLSRIAAAIRAWDTSTRTVEERTADETAYGAREPEPVTRTDYPNAPVRGDRFGWMVTSACGARMGGPYRDRSHAENVRTTFAPDALLEHVVLDWRSEA